MYKYYQPNKLDIKDKVGDCCIRALTKFFDLSWVEVFDKLVAYARKSQTMPNDINNVKAMLKDEKYDYTSTAKEKIKVEQFTLKHKTGTYALYVRSGFRTHMVAVVDGNYYDTWDSGKKYVYGYWRKESERVCG